VQRREVVIRRFHAEDRGSVAALLERLSPESLHQRFHSAGVEVDATVLDSVTAGQALVAELDAGSSDWPRIPEPTRNSELWSTMCARAAESGAPSAANCCATRSAPESAP
jgi:hypothetical protein